jgi:glutamate carboxypeptidase
MSHDRDATFVRMTSSSHAKRMLDYLQSQNAQMVEMLKSFAEIESPSHVPASQQAIQALLQRALQDEGYRVRYIAGKKTGGHLLAVPRWRISGQPIQLMLGHCDTVWPQGTLEKMPLTLCDGRLRGPGVYDMKAGLVQAIFAVRAVGELGIKPPVAPVFFINSDEEIGSPESFQHIMRLARLADRAFVMEPSLGPDGKLKTARKGVGRFVVRVIGRAAHAGLAPEEGASAILELSHVVQALFALNDPERGIMVNVGTIDGGTRPNVIAPESSAEVDVRVANRDDATFIEKAIHSLQPTTPRTRLEISGSIGRPPMERTAGNQKLWRLAQEAADELDLQIDEATAGGGSDGNHTSQLTPTLDGLGAVGDGAHAVTEFVEVEQMPVRAALLARMLLVPPVRSLVS